MSSRPTPRPKRISEASVASATARRPRGRPKVRSDAEQRDTIIHAANALFVSNGFSHTTMDDIAGACRVSKRTLYRLFPSKIELFASIVRAHRTCMLALPGAYDGVPIDDALERIFRIDLSPSAERQRHAILKLVRVESAHHPELAEIMTREGADMARAELAAWLAERAAAGEIAIDDPDIAAHVLTDMIFGMLAAKGPDDPLVPKGRDRAAHVRRCISIFLHGVARDPVSA